MKTLKLLAGVLCLAATRVAAQEPAWNAAAIKQCDVPASWASSTPT